MKFPTHTNKPILFLRSGASLIVGHLADQNYGGLLRSLLLHAGVGAASVKLYGEVTIAAYFDGLRCWCFAEYFANS